MPDGYETELLFGTEDNDLEDGPIEIYSMPAVLASVNKKDESIFTPEEWVDILEKVEKGEILFFETRTEELAYFNGRTSN